MPEEMKRAQAAAAAGAAASSSAGQAHKTAAAAPPQLVKVPVAQSPSPKGSAAHKSPLVRQIWLHGSPDMLLFLYGVVLAKGTVQLASLCCSLRADYAS